MSAVSPFSIDYATARQRFREQATACGAELSTYPINAPGPGGLPLSIDLARLPGADPSRLLLITSGLHGIEGFFGSAVQLDWLARLPQRQQPLPVPVVLVHALNPYGFAWRRRTNENNVDLNRNFLLPDDEYRGAPAVLEQLNPFINPGTPPPRISFFLVPALVCIARYGFHNLKSALTSGQYEYPRGLFYGGNGPEESTRLVQTSIQEWLAPARHVLHLDFHTGLGRSGTYQILTTEPAGAAHLRWLAEIFGEDHIVPLDHNARDRGTWRGGMGLWLTETLRETSIDYIFALPEFGTYPGLKVFQALQEENRVHQHPDHPRYEPLKQRLSEAFVPRSEAWRSRVLTAAADILEKAEAALAPR